ncbi:hypothetical protein GJ904_19900 [Salmonella enterica]|nr:hypothetical protein [Salmonella enterica subsp. enterica serovar Saintpaul]EEC1303328.1 hypothetical protein [Salmonella enterica]
MNVRTLIDHYYGGNRSLFQRAMGVSHRTVSRWLADDAVVANGAIHLRSKPVRNVPALPAPDERDQFEAMMAARQPGIDLTRVGVAYVNQHVQYAWEGWSMALEHHTREDLNMPWRK